MFFREKDSVQIVIISGLIFYFKLITLVKISAYSFQNTLTSMLYAKGISVAIKFVAESETIIVCKVTGFCTHLLSLSLCIK